MYLSITICPILRFISNCENFIILSVIFEIILCTLQQLNLSSVMYRNILSHVVRIIVLMYMQIPMVWINYVIRFTSLWKIINYFNFSWGFLMPLAQFSIFGGSGGTGWLLWLNSEPHILLLLLLLLLLLSMLLISRSKDTWKTLMFDW